MQNIKPGSLTVITSFPGEGKTSCLNDMVSELCFNKKYPCVYFSLELSSENLSKRLFHEDQNFSDVQKSCLLIDDTWSLSIDELTERIKSYVLKDGIKFYFIDCIDLVSVQNADLPFYDKQSVIIHQLKKIATDLKISIILTCQTLKNEERKQFTADVDKVIVIKKN